MGATTLVLTGVFGFVTLFFLEDSIGVQMTTIGVVHIVLAGLSSVASMSSMLLVGFWFRGELSSRAAGIYSLISVGFVFVTEGVTAAMGVSHGPIGGLMERMTIGGFMQWLFVTALIFSGGFRTALPAK
ncbi:MAG: hypothetical protein ABSG85_04240 [Spirochaetia bacterium]